MAAIQTHREIGVSCPLGEDILLFHHMTAIEELGELSVYHLEVLSENGDIALADVLGKAMTVRLELWNRSTRYFNALVSDFSYRGKAGNFHRYSAVLQPWCWLLTKTTDCRIFQNQKVPDIIQGIFREYGFTDFDVSGLTAHYEPWEYCVQYRESDFHFISRLMEHEGIYYYFKHEADKHILMLADAMSAHKTVADYEAIPYQISNDTHVVEIENIQSWSVKQSVQPGTYTLNAFDFEKPRASNSGGLEVKNNQRRPHAVPDFEIYDHSRAYVQAPHGEAYARVRLEALHAQYEQVHGHASARGITTGALFTLTDHPRRDQNRQYLVVRTETTLHLDAYESGDSGSSPVCTCEFGAIPSQTPFRLLEKTHKPFVQGPQTAIVVGKPGEEIWTDKYGRVKVQFHWDREGKRDENSSCWLRVSQPWAGKGWGTVAIPRIGQEVIVDFIEGDPDRPIITGRVYNAEQGLPYTLPAAAHMMGFKSNSTPGGSGYCEMVIHDQAGKEKIVIHSQKDMSTTVQHNQSTVVNGPFQTTVVSSGFQETSVKKHVRLESLTEHIEITAATRITLTCGASQITMDKDGHINILGTNITTAATATSMHLGQPIHLNPSAPAPMRLVPATTAIPLVPAGGISGSAGSRGPVGKKPSALSAAPDKVHSGKYAPPVKTGLGGDVDQLAAKSPSLQNDMKALQDDGWKIAYGDAGKGSYADRIAKTITIDGSEKGNAASVVQTLAHEVGHATYDYKPDLSSKLAYVNGCLADEGAATLNNIKVQREILAASGPNIGIAGNPANQVAYNAAFDQFVKDGNAPSARQVIGAIFGSGEVTSTTGQPYADYYGSWYDKTYPPKK